MKNVYVIEDCPVLAESISNTLRRCGYNTYVYQDPTAFLGEPTVQSPAVIVLDMRLPKLSGIELQRRLEQCQRHTPIVFISGDFQSQEIVQAMKQGAIDFLFKPFNLDDLLNAIESGLAKDAERLKNTHTTQSLLERYGSLTAREKEVCIRLAGGMLSKQVAVDLGISNATVKIHKSRVFEKMETGSLQELALALQQLGVVR